MQKKTKTFYFRGIEPRSMEHFFFRKSNQLLTISKNIAGWSFLFS